MKRSPVLIATLCLAGCTGQGASPTTATSTRPTAIPLPPSPAQTADDPASAGPASVASAPAEPAYDLEVDRGQIIQALRLELGARADIVVVNDVWVFAGPPGQVAGAVEFARKAMSGYFHNRFRTPPKKAITVILYPSADPYNAYCKRSWEGRCPSIYGFFQPSRRRLVMNVGLGIGTLTHELVHPIVESDFPQAPTWINEGIASLYEAPLMPKHGEIHGAKNWRYPRLLTGLSSARDRDDARLDRLFGLSDEDFRADKEDLHYAMARYLCQWLDQRNQLWPFYQAWRDHFDTDPTGEKAFSQTVGMAPSQAHEVWVRWVRSL